jgi:prepilin-type N-terminal cleavage/methylation domain-containing protein
MKPRSSFVIRHSSFCGAFTLIEVLVATAVLAMLIALVAQMVDGATTTALYSRRHIDADTEARTVFDRMGRDFDGMLNRSDADCIFAKNSGNDAFYFQGEAVAYTGGITSANDRSTLAFVGYRVNPATFQIERLGKALSWDGVPSTSGSAGGPVFLSGVATSGTGASFDPKSTIAGRWPGMVGDSPAFTSGTDETWHVVSPAVFRMEFAFMKKDAATGKYVPYVPSGSTADNPLTGSLGGLKDVAAITVGIAVLDEGSQAMLPAGGMADLAAKLVDVTTLGATSSPADLMLAKWNGNLLPLYGGGTATVPKAVASNIRIYQRTFYLSPVVR